jgi:hypothetical protein
MNLCLIFLLLDMRLVPSENKPDEKKQGPVAYVNRPLVKVRDIEFHCYWVNLRLFFVNYD